MEVISNKGMDRDVTRGSEQSCVGRCMGYTLPTNVGPEILEAVPNIVKW